MSECTLCSGDPDVNCTREGCRFSKVASEKAPPLPKAETEKKINPNHPFVKAKKRLGKLYSKGKKFFKGDNSDRGFKMH